MAEVRGQGEGGTFAFHRDGRGAMEVQEMKEYGYVEKDEYASSDLKGYFCATCKWFQRKPRTILGFPTEYDGWCRKYKFKDRSYGCCDGWEQGKG